MSLLKGIHHVAIICSNYQVSKKFYTEILGFKIEREVCREEPQSYKLDLSLNGAYCIELFSFPDPPPRLSRPEANGLRHIAFAVTDVQKTVDYLISIGVKVEEIRRDEFTGKQFTFINDPDDLPIELYEN